MKVFSADALRAFNLGVGYILSCVLLAFIVVLKT